MIRRSFPLLVIALLASTPASARFGKSGGSGSSSSSSSSSVHRAAPVGSVPRSSGTNSSSYNAGGYSTGYGPGFGYGYNPWRYGYYSGAFVPMYGYGFGYYAASPYGYGYRSPYGYAPGVVDSGVRQEPSSLRVTIGLEATPYVSSERGGFGLGGVAMFEGQRWGVSLLFQNIAAPSQDGLSTFDHIQQFNAHATFAFLTGKYGRLRIEAGADSLFASNLVVLAPTAGLSGSLWVGGPVALEASVMVTPWPIRQLDMRGGIVVGLGPIGLRAGWRTQVLDDQGLVDGIVNHDTFMGPYAGVSVVF